MNSMPSSSLMTCGKVVSFGHIFSRHVGCGSSDARKVGYKPAEQRSRERKHQGENQQGKIDLRKSDAMSTVRSQRTQATPSPVKRSPQHTTRDADHLPPR